MAKTVKEFKGLGVAGQQKAQDKNTMLIEYAFKELITPNEQKQAKCDTPHKKLAYLVNKFKRTPYIVRKTMQTFSDEYERKGGAWVVKTPDYIQYTDKELAIMNKSDDS